MLIDINANIGHWPFQQTNCNTCRELLQRMNNYGIDISVVSNMNGIFYKDTHASNEELMEEISSSRTFSGRFIPFGIINPVYAGWQRDLKTCHEKFGMKGIRIYPQYNDYKLTDTASIEMIKAARDLGVIIAFTVRMVDRRLRHWMDINDVWNVSDLIPVIKEVPDAKYMILNISNGMQLNDDETELLRKTNVLFDTSGRNFNYGASLIEMLGKEKFAFGSHTPVLDPLTGLIRIEALRENEADEAAKDMFRSGNARRMLNI